ncbi:MAG TPA: cytochrome c oxidase subunit 3 [Anaerolineales bacterium]|nr:cytochrome c oxidase subunit 3 [Anaerolineales bacterium]
MEHTNEADVLRQGAIVLVFLAVLSLIEYFIAIAIGAVVLLLVVIIIKVGLVMYYYMHIAKLGEDTTGLDPHGYEYKTGTNRLGLWLFLLSDAFVFGGLAVARFNLLGLNRPALNQLLGLTVTAVLLMSSFFMNRAETSMAHGDRRGFIMGMSITLLLGMVFVAGVLGVEWPSAIREGITPSASAAGAVFFMMTGMHALHVVTGLIFLGIVLHKGMRGLYSTEKHWGVESAAVYWHFVDVVWIFFYPALYLIGKSL